MHVASPAEQVEHWITQGIAARTGLNQDEARTQARTLLQQYNQRTNPLSVPVDDRTDYSQYFDPED